MTTGYVNTQDSKGTSGSASKSSSKNTDLGSKAATKGQSKDVGEFSRGKDKGGGATKVRPPAKGPEGKGRNTVSAGKAEETDADFKSYADLTKKGQTVSAFDTYAYEQADWSMEIKDKGQKTALRSVLTFLRKDSNNVTAFGDFDLADFISDGLANLPAMGAYARASTQSEATVPVTLATNVADARDYGIDILKLEASTEGAILKWILTPSEFDRLRTENGNQVAKFANYVTTCKPLLHAGDGWEIDSYLKLSKTSDPASFTDIKDVRNYHRFQDAALQAMRGSLKGNTANKPMTLVLQSAFDHNHAFHHDPEMTAVLQEPSNHSYMIEGAATLAGISGKLPDVVKKHGKEEPDPDKKGGKVKKIDQIMIAGHGYSKGIELTGTLATNPDGSVKTNENGKPLTKEDGIDVSNAAWNKDEKKRSEAFMKELLGYMSADPSTPHGRIVFNACLTASNEIDASKINPADPVSKQQNAMKGEYAKNPSIVDAMRKFAKEAGKSNVSVLGATGSFGLSGLIDKKGGLDIVTDGKDPLGTGRTRTKDPELTNPDKFVYVEKGTDPNGVMLAAAECWAVDAAKTMKAIRARRGKKAGSGWKETVIQTFYGMIVASYSKSGADIARLAGFAHGFELLASAGHARPNGLWNLTNTSDWAALEKGLSTNSKVWAKKHVGVVFYQAWFYNDAKKLPDFLKAAAALNCRTLLPYIHVGSLHNFINTVIPSTTANKPPDAGRLRIALVDYIKSESAGGTMAQTTKDYLSSLVTAGKFTVDVATPMNKLRSEDQLLSALGLNPRDQHSTTISSTGKKTKDLPKANVDMKGDGKKNEAHVDALSKTGVVANCYYLNVRAQPSMNGRTVSRSLKRGEKVYIMGKSGNWYLIDHQGKRGYVYHKYIATT